MLAKSGVVVIGGGVIGCAVAYYLSKKGARVTEPVKFSPASPPIFALLLPIS